MGQGCGVYIFKISDETIEKIRQQELIFLNQARLSLDRKTKYNQWKFYEKSNSLINKIGIKGLYCAISPHGLSGGGDMNEDNQAWKYFNQLNKRVEFHTETEDERREMVIYPDEGILIYAYSD